MEIMLQTESVKKSTSFLELSRAKTVTDLHKGVLDILGRLGYSDYAFTSLEGISSNMLLSLPKAMLIEYFDQGFYKYDWVIEHLSYCGQDPQESSQPIFQSTVADYAMSAPFDTTPICSNQEHMKMIKTYGYNDFYNIPITSIRGGMTLLSVTTKGVEACDFIDSTLKNADQLQNLALSLDYITAEKFSSDIYATEKKGIITLNKKALQLVETMTKEDLSLKAAATRCYISLNTANRYIAKVREATGFSTRWDAVIKCIESGIISVNVR